MCFICLQLFSIQYNIPPKKVEKNVVDCIVYFHGSILIPTTLTHPLLSGSQNSIFSVTSTGPSTIDGNSTILCQFESVSENTTQECELCYSTRSDRCEPESDFICETITLTDGDVMAVFDEISFPYSSPEGPYGPFCYQVTVRIDNVTVAAVNGEAYTGMKNVDQSHATCMFTLKYKFPSSSLSLSLSHTHTHKHTQVAHPML